MNKKNKILLTISLGILLGACGEKASNLKAENKTLIMAQGADSRTLDPHKAIDTPSVRGYINLYDQLVKKDKDMNIVPSLAKSWEKIDEITTLFHLNDNVKFHNGETLTAEDVKFSIERMKDAPTVAFLVGEIDKVEALDNKTVKITTKKPFGPLLSHLSHPGASILNKKAVLEKGEEYGQKPIGTGPYKLSEWIAGDRLIYEAHKNYFKGEALSKKLIIRSIPEGSNRTIALETGEVDIATDIDPLDIERVRKHEKLNLIEDKSLGTSNLTINTTKKPFDDIRIRKALSYAINISPIIEAVYKNNASPANSPLSSKIPGYNKEIPAYEYNPEKAKKLLEEAGYPNGFKTTIWVNDNQIRKDIATILQDQFKQVGIEMNIDVLEWGSYMAKTSKSEHELCMFGWVTVTGDGDYGLYPLFHTSARGPAGNRSFYSNLKVDTLLENARSSTDNNERNNLYKEVQQIIQEELPMITLAFTNQNVGIQKNIENFVLHPTGYYELSQVKNNK